MAIRSLTQAQRDQIARSAAQRMVPPLTLVVAELARRNFMPPERRIELAALAISNVRNPTTSYEIAQRALRWLKDQLYL